jgi:hypothetical protein
VWGIHTASLGKARVDRSSISVERLQEVVRQEMEYVAARLLQSLEHVPEPEQSSQPFRELRLWLEQRARTPIDGARLVNLSRRAELLGLPRLAAAAGAAARRMDELAVRVEWLTHGTSPEELMVLHPVRDSDRIYHHLLRSFRVEARVVETLAINRVATWESLALFLRSTREAECNPVGRFIDTYALFANYFEWGADSERGTRAIERINQIHGR